MGHSHIETPPITVISGGIGSGKGTIIHALSRELNLTWVPTHTTRPIRQDDFVLSSHIFDTETTFTRHKDRGEFIETINVSGHHYGLLRSDLERELQHQRPVILELTVSGGITLARAYPQTMLIFIRTNEVFSHEHLSHHHLPKQEEQEWIKLSKQDEQLAKQEYDYLVDNVEDHPEEAIEAIKEKIIEHFPMFNTITAQSTV